MKILIADEHPLVRMVLRRTLQVAYPDLVLEEADNAGNLLKKAMRDKWDLIISDLFSPVQSGFNLLNQLKKKVPGIPILTLTMLPAEEYAVKTITNGSSGYLIKKDLSIELIKAVETILGGKKFLNPEVSDMLESYYESKSKENKFKILAGNYFQLPKMLTSAKAFHSLAY